MTDPPIAYASLPADHYPFRVEFIAARTGAVVHEIRVSGPGAIQVPGLRDQHGPIAVRVTYADGAVVNLPAPEDDLM